jgi:hypothetical protein
MFRKSTVLIAALVITLGLTTGRSEGKDFFYYLGYGVVQVIDGETDDIVADIPVDGWVRDVGLTADKKFLYVMTKRHLIHKLDLAANRVVHTVDINGGGWDRFIYGFAVAGDGKSAYAGMLSRTTEAGEVVIGKPSVAQLDLGTGKIIRSLEVPWGVASLTTVKDENQVYAIGKDLYKIDVSGSEMKIVETYPMYEKKMNFLPFWNYAWENGGVFMANYYTPELMGLLAIDKGTGEIKDTPLNGIPVFAYSVIYSPDKTKAYAVMDDLNVIPPSCRSTRARATESTCRATGRRSTWARGGRRSRSSIRLR